MPVRVLADALCHCCERTRIEVGSVNDILRDTCTHLVVGNDADEQNGEQQKLEADIVRRILITV